MGLDKGLEPDVIIMWTNVVLSSINSVEQLPMEYTWYQYVR